MKIALLILVALGCLSCTSEYGVECRVPSATTLQAGPEVPAADRAAFESAAAAWAAWTGLPAIQLTGAGVGGPSLRPVTDPAEVAELDAHHGAHVYAQEDDDGSVSYVPSRIRDADDLRTLFLHEIGHALGMGHVGAKGSLMFLDPRASRGRLGPWDREAIRLCLRVNAD